MITPARLEAYMRRVAAIQYQSLTIGPFELYFHPNDPLCYFNYAKPTEAVSGNLRANLVALRAAYEQRDRMPRFEYIEDFAPQLAVALEAAGFEREEKQSLMVCHREEFRRAPGPDGFTLERLTALSPADALQSYLTIQAEAFMDGESDNTGERRIEDQRQSLLAGTSAFLAYLHGQPAAVAATTLPLDGFSELAGVATTPSLQQKGAGSAVASAAVAAAFAGGAEAVFLVAQDEHAGRIYRRLGFQHRWWALSYRAAA